MAPAAAGIFPHQPAELGADAFRLLGIEERPNWLGWIGEGGIVGIDLHLGQQAGDVTGLSASRNAFSSACMRR